MMGPDSEGEVENKYDLELRRATQELAEIEQQLHLKIGWNSRRKPTEKFNNTNKSLTVHDSSFHLDKIKQKRGLVSTISIPNNNDNRRDTKNSPHHMHEIRPDSAKYKKFDSNPPNACTTNNVDSPNIYNGHSIGKEAAIDESTNDVAAADNNGPRAKEQPQIDRSESLQQSKRIFNPQMSARLFGNVMSVLKERSDQAKNPHEAELLKRTAEEKQLRKTIDSDKIFVERKHQLMAEHANKLQYLSFVRQKKQVADEFKMWHKNLNFLTNFVRTKCEPKIFYKPNVLNENFQKIIDQTKSKVDRVIEARKQEVDTELERLDALYLKRSEDQSDKFIIQTDPDSQTTTNAAH